jgi:anti-anti-sigma regulatory factor
MSNPDMKWNACLVASGQSFRIEAEIGTGPVVIRPHGLINEDLNFGTVLEFIDTLKTKPTQIIFDMSSVSRINSCGVREWLLFLQRMQSRFKISFSRANEVFIEVASSVPSVFGKPIAPVGQIEAPFFCARCSRRLLTYLDTGEAIRGGQVVIAAQKCPQCGGELEFDGLQEEYFGFLL